MKTLQSKVNYYLSLCSKINEYEYDDCDETTIEFLKDLKSIKENEIKNYFKNFYESQIKCSIADLLKHSCSLTEEKDNLIELFFYILNKMV